MKKTIEVRVEIDVHGNKPQWCGDCDYCTSIFGGWRCTLFLKNNKPRLLRYPNPFHVARCPTCLAAKEVKDEQQS